MTQRDPNYDDNGEWIDDDSDDQTSVDYDPMTTGGIRDIVADLRLAKRQHAEHASYNDGCGWCINERARAKDDE